MCRRRSRRRRRLPRPHRNKGRTGSNLTARIGVRAAGEGRISGPTPNHPQGLRSMIRTLEKPLPASSRDEARWEAFVARDASFEGQFYIAVKTTGVYCRPGCPARLPKRANVRFFDTRERGRAGRLPPLQALQARPAFARGASRREDRASLPADRDRRRGAEARRSCRRRGLEPLSLPPHLQAGARRHAEGLRHGASGERACARVWEEAEL